MKPSGDGKGPAAPPSMGNYAIQALKSDLLEGRLRPGERVTAELISRRLAISHIPVREALRFLEAEGHLVHDPRRGYTVASLSAEEADDILKTRSLIEPYAYSIGVPRLTAEDDRRLAAAIREMELAVDAKDSGTLARANREFHFVPFHRTERPWLLRFLNELWDAAARYQASLFMASGWEDEIRVHHRELLDAMLARDAARVNEIMSRHRRFTPTPDMEGYTPALLD